MAKREKPGQSSRKYAESVLSDEYDDVAKNQIGTIAAGLGVGGVSDKVSKKSARISSKYAESGKEFRKQAERATRDRDLWKKIGDEFEMAGDWAKKGQPNLHDVIVNKKPLTRTPDLPGAETKYALANEAMKKATASHERANIFRQATSRAQQASGRFGARARGALMGSRAALGAAAAGLVGGEIARSSLNKSRDRIASDKVKIDEAKAKNAKLQSKRSK